MAFVAGGTPSGWAFHEELRQLLRSRLILVQLLGLAAGILLIVMLFTVPQNDASPMQATPEVGWLGLVVWGEGLVGVIAISFCSRMSLRFLRIWEAIFFASLACFLGYCRFVSLVELPESASNTQIGFSGLSSLQLFIGLLLTYGVLIPNSRLRSCLVVAGLSAVPLAALAVAAVVNPVLRSGHVLPLVLQWAFVLLFPSAIAVFVAARTTTLQRRAFEAERRAEQVGQYALKRKLGEGGMGEVWLAEHALLKRPCAVKFIRPDLAVHPATISRFAREVQAVTRLSHTNTVRVYDYGRSEDGSFYYVMEYLDGPTLEELVRDTGPLSPGYVVYLLRQVCGALAEAHAAGLVHRDLKPGNVIVAALGGQQDVAKLLDFGLVQDLSMDVADRLTQTGTVMGTPAYMSPEQAAGESAVDARSDIYSLGAVAFFALTGQPPFQGKTLGQLLAAHRSEPPLALTDLRSDVPDDLVAVVASCLAKNPMDRFQSVVDLDHALAQCGCAADWSAERDRRIRSVPSRT